MLLNDKLFRHLSLKINHLDKQLAKPETERTLHPGVLWAFVVVGVVLAGVFAFYQLQTADPYIKSVLTLSGDPVNGHAIFQTNCAGCHGLEAQGRVGPSLDHISKRRSRVSLIHQVISGDTPPMPQFQPNPQEMADLLGFLEKL